MSQSDAGRKSAIDKTPPNLPKQDEAGKPVDVVKKDIRQGEDKNTDGIDKVITPTTIKAKEQEASEINKSAADIERKLNS
jgi:hypothetical protein